MNKKIIQIALMGLALGVCLSAKQIPRIDNRVLAMSQCSKTNDTTDQEDSSNCNDCQRSKNECSYRGKQSKNDQVNSKVKKSAAQKVVQGE